MTTPASAGCHPHPPRSFCLAALAAVCLALPACGGGHNPVSGKVLYKKQPAAGALVIFHPKDGDARPTAPRPTGVVGADGTFTLESIRTPGAPAGDYVVTITWPGKPAGGKIGMAGGEDEKASATDQLQGRYADRTTSKITATVKAGSNTLAPFELD